MELNTSHFENLSSEELTKLLSDGIKKLLEGNETTFSQSDFDSRLHDLVELDGDWRGHLEWFSIALKHTINEIKCDNLMKLFSTQFFALILKELGFEPSEE